jgi:hypothetical protein
MSKPTQTVEVLSYAIALDDEVDYRWPQRQTATLMCLGMGLLLLSMAIRAHGVTWPIRYHASILAVVAHGVTWIAAIAYLSVVGFRLFKPLHDSRYLVSLCAIAGCIAVTLYHSEYQRRLDFLLWLSMVFIQVAVLTLSVCKNTGASLRWFMQIMGCGMCIFTASILVPYWDRFFTNPPSFRGAVGNIMALSTGCLVVGCVSLLVDSWASARAGVSLRQVIRFCFVLGTILGLLVVGAHVVYRTSLLGLRQSGIAWLVGVAGAMILLLALLNASRSMRR